MHQREASSYARKFLFGKHQVGRVDLDRYCNERGIGLVPPEFDELSNDEAKTIENLRASLSPSL